MKRLIIATIAISASIAILVTGGWIIGKGGTAGMPLFIFGLLAFVASVATSLPQSTQHARDD